MGSDESTRQRFQRATELNVSGAGSELLQTFINRTVQMLTLREFGLQAVLPRRPGQGNAEYINRRTAGTTGGEWVTDTDSATEEAGAYAQTSFIYRTLLTRGKITRKLQATGRSYADILGLEMAAKAEYFANQLERGLMSSNTFSVEANAPNGFLTLIQGLGAADLDQTVTNGAIDAVNLEKLDQAIDLVKGSASRSELVIVGSFAGMRQLGAVLQTYQRWNDVTEIAAGFRVRTYDGIPMIISTQMSNTLQTAATGLITGNAGAETALMVLNTRYCYMSELTPTTVMPLARSSSQYDQFDMFWDGAPVLSNTLGASLYVGITT